LAVGSKTDASFNRRGHHAESRTRQRLSRLCGQPARCIRGRCECGRRSRKVREVEDVEYFRSEFDVRRFGDREPLVQYQVELTEVRTAGSVSREVAERSWLRDRKRWRIDQRAVVIEVEWHPLNLIRPPLRTRR